MLRSQPLLSVRQSGFDQKRGQTESLISLASLSTKTLPELPPFNVHPIDPSTVEDVANQREDPESLGLLSKYWVFSGLILTTLISSLLLIANTKRWIVSNRVFDVVRQNRGSVQLIVQVISNALGLLHVTIMSVLVNYSTRLWLASMPTSLKTLGLWNLLLRRSLDLRMPVHFLATLLVFIAICITPSALWAGALTPISVLVFQPGEIFLSSYSDTRLLRYDWGSRLDLPSVQNTKGSFAYNVGEFFLGSLLYSASTATTVDGSIRQHAKLDFSRFTYRGRSYGVGSSIGLIDDNILLNPLVTQYAFQETGYKPVVKCIYNASSAFFLANNTGLKMIYSAYGYLPNSDDNQEWASYTGFSMDAIVAIGVASSNTSIGRMFSIAAGDQYPLLNNAQCSIDFQPTRFNITVNMTNRNITVIPTKDIEIKDIEPTGFLTFIANWQFTLMSTDQTSFYSSLIGNSISASVTNYIRSNYPSPTIPLDDQKVATLAGLENSVEAMIDDILGMYASCQLMIAKDVQLAPSVITFNAFQIGDGKYIVAMVVFNALLVLVVFVEAVRTRGWRSLVEFDYMDPRDLIVWSSRGGRGVARVVDDIEVHEIDGIIGEEGRGESEDIQRRIGDVKIVRNGWKIALA